MESPGSPHFLNQAPPRVQQLGLPVLVLMAHLGHTVRLGVNPVMVIAVMVVLMAELTVVTVVAVVVGVADAAVNM